MAMAPEKTFVIGDVHGCLDLLNRLLRVIPWRPGRDGLVFLGDLIDRGPHSRGVVECVLDLIHHYDHVGCILGNHEAMLLDYLNGKDQEVYLHNQGYTTLSEYRRPFGRLSIPQEHIEFFGSLLPYLELEGHYLVHAGFMPAIPLSDQRLEDMVWIREPFLHSPYDFGKKVVFGHTVFSRPLVMENKIGLDTGAVYGNRLTCLELPEEVFYAIDARIS